MLIKVLLLIAQLVGTVVVNSYYHINLGGFVGSNSNTITISFNCSNTSFNPLSNLVELRMGGVVGNNEENGNIENSYNTGNITCSSKFDFFKAYIAGISGNNSSSVNNVYSTGKIYILDAMPQRFYIGGTIGDAGKNDTNLYCLEDPYDTSITANKFSMETVLTENELKSHSFVDKLNENIPGIWKSDNNINSGYPALFWQ